LPSINSISGDSHIEKHSGKKQKKSANDRSFKGKKPAPNSIQIIELTTAVAGTSASSSRSHLNFTHSIDSPIGFEIVKVSH
jgi:hypothetical protein